MAQFNLEDYAPVQDRIAAFYRDFEDGSIRSRMVVREGPEVVFEARAYRSPNDVAAGVYTSGWAHEVEGKSPVNRGSHVENCETSAIGRALANLGYTTNANRPTRSEMLKVHRVRQEHEELLERIRAAGAVCEEEAEIRIGGVSRNLKAYVRENWPTLKEQFRLARTVVEAIEEAEGLTLSRAASEPADAKQDASVPLYAAREGLRLGGSGKHKDTAIADLPDDVLLEARDKLLESESRGHLPPAHAKKLEALQAEAVRRDELAAAMQEEA